MTDNLPALYKRLNKALAARGYQLVKAREWCLCDLPRPCWTASIWVTKEGERIALFGRAFRIQFYDDDELLLFPQSDKE